MKAQVRPYHGTPTLFLDDEPIFAGMHLLIAQDLKDLAQDQLTMAVYAQAGIHIYVIDTAGPHWVGPRPGQEGFFDYSAAGPRLREIMAADPQALFWLRLSFETNGLPGDWWNQMYPDEMEVLSDGQRVSQTPASLVWQAQVKESITGLIRRLRQEGLYERVIAYQINTGSAGEWVKGASSLGLPCGDYSLPMLRYFRHWLRQRYQDDPSRLQAAWADPHVSFETAQVPSCTEQFSTTYPSLRDPQRERKVVDFYQCYADLSAESHNRARGGLDQGETKGVGAFDSASLRGGSTPLRLRVEVGSHFGHRGANAVGCRRENLETHQIPIRGSAAPGSRPAGLIPLPGAPAGPL